MLSLQAEQVVSLGKDSYVQLTLDCSLDDVETLSQDERDLVQKGFEQELRTITANLAHLLAAMFSSRGAAPFGLTVLRAQIDAAATILQDFLEHQTVDEIVRSMLEGIPKPPGRN